MDRVERGACVFTHLCRYTSKEFVVKIAVIIVGVDRGGGGTKSSYTHSRDKIAVWKRTAGLRSGTFSDLNLEC